MPRLAHITHPAIPAFIMLFLMAATPAASQKKRVVGLIEQVMIFPGNFMMTAKLDTGAKTSSLGAARIQEFERKGEPWVRFQVEIRKGITKTLERKMLRVVRIRRHNHRIQRRPAIMLGICLGDYYGEVEVNLVDRRGFNYALLIGRTFIRGNFIVDPSLKFTTPPRCRGMCEP